MKHGKKYQESVKLIDKQKLYDPQEGIEIGRASCRERVFGKV